MPAVFFDTSVLVPVVTEQLGNHGGAHARFVSELKAGRQPCCSSHTLAECYATLTALPLPRRISGSEAAHLIEVNFVRKMRILDLNAQHYQSAIRLCADLGRLSGQIYDALHLTAALDAGCKQLFTYNLTHFRALGQNQIIISAP
ncbi:MAG: type II toxin-antitoxin system VapC family toxin [Opitutales bacterium]